MKRRIISSLLTIIMTVGIIGNIPVGAVEYGVENQNMPAKTYTQKFSDVPPSHWGFSYIGEMVERGVLNGYPDGRYYPENTVTRAEFAKIMVGAANLVIPDYNTYIYCDVELDEWYAPYINVATPYMTGYVTEDGNAFMPDAPALREDIAVALVKLKGYNVSIYDESILSTMFTDYQSISENAKPYVAVAVERGLVSGYDDRTFRGQATITRAEAATLLWRACQYGNDNKLVGTEMFGEIEDEVPVIEPTKTPVAIATETPTAKPTVSPTEESTEEPTPTPEAETEYLYELKTLTQDIENVSQMVIADDTVIYRDGNKIMQLFKNDVNCIFDSQDIGYLGNESISKERLANLKTTLYSIGYNEGNGCIYALVKQDLSVFYIYNVSENTCEGNFEPYCNTEWSGPGDQHATLFGITMEFNDENQFSVGGDFKGNMYITSRVPNLFYTDKETNEPDNIVCFWQVYFADNTIVHISSNKIEVLSNRTGEWQNIDYYCQELSSGDFFAFGEDNKAYFSAHSPSGGKGVFSVDLDGNEEIICTIDDVDNVDGKIIDFKAIKHNSSAVDKNGSIYYWDSNYNCIRKLSKK